MKVSQMSKKQKAQLFGAIGHAVDELLGSGENLFFLLIVDDQGGMVDCKNINRSAIPRLLREYADRVEKS
jgi:malonyl CoA-acyl carrier protein transacylase